MDFPCVQSISWPAGRHSPFQCRFMFYAGRSFCDIFPLDLLGLLARYCNFEEDRDKERFVTRHGSEWTPICKEQGVKATVYQYQLEHCVKRQFRLHYPDNPQQYIPGFITEHSDDCRICQDPDVKDHAHIWLCTDQWVGHMGRQLMGSQFEITSNHEEKQIDTVCISVLDNGYGNPDHQTKQILLQTLPVPFNSRSLTNVYAKERCYTLLIEVEGTDHVDLVIIKAHFVNPYVRVWFGRRDALGMDILLDLHGPFLFNDDEEARFKKKKEKKKMQKRFFIGRYAPRSNSNKRKRTGRMIADLMFQSTKIIEKEKNPNCVIVDFGRGIAAWKVNLG